ncbi:MAG: hypothetical protein EXS14_05250 [Planctomycetes bacterium]|nr:hypothetical protein [Planctomycetota bacterium]
MRIHREEIGASLLLLALLLPLQLSVEFLADDFYMGRAIADAAVEHPGITGAINTAFTRRWTTDFDVFRPLTILSLQADWALFGNRPGLHHLVNLLLWIACAWMIARSVEQLGTLCLKPLRRAAIMLAFGLSPAVVECLGWCVAREDLLCGGFGLAALLLQLRAPQRSVARALLVACAFLAKETAVTLPCLLLWTELTLLRPDPNGNRPAVLSRFMRALPCFAVLAGALVLRKLLFGQVAGLYGGKTYMAWLAEPDLIRSLLSSISTDLLRLTVPIAQTSATIGSALHFFEAIFLLATAFALALALADSAGRRRTVAFSAWILAPLLLVAVPRRTVGPNLEDSRILLLPLVGLLLICAPALCTRHLRAWNIAAIALFLLTMGLTQQRNLATYSAASEQIQSLRAEAHRAAEGSDTLIVTGAIPPESATGLIPALIQRNGAFLLSEGFWLFTQPPFDNGPHLLGWSRTNGLLLQSVYAPPKGEQQDSRAAPALAALTMRAGWLHIDRITPRNAGALTIAARETTWNLSNASNPLELQFTTNSGGPLRAHLLAPGEDAHAIAEVTLTRETGSVALSAWRLQSGSLRGLPLTREILHASGARELLAWIEDPATARCSRVFVMTLQP